MNKIQIKVNAANLLDNLRYAFTNTVTVLSELLQNARRAGATKVEVNFNLEDKTLTVIDDGCGISDFQSLLTVAESGWDSEICEKEHPYGLGFLASLYSCEKITAASVGGSVDFDTSYAIAFGEIPVQKTISTPGTRITLYGFKSDLTKNAVEKMVRGFSLPVTFNGEEMPRPHAIDSIAYDHVDGVGSFCLQGIHNGNKGNSSSSIVCYLLGFKVYESSHSHSLLHANIIHLDPTAFSARMPDRNCLINEETAIKKVDWEVRRIWIDLLKKKSAELSAEEFLKIYEDVAVAVNKDMLKNIPLLPRQAVFCLVDTPKYQSCFDNFISINPDYVTKEDVVSGKVRLCEDFSCLDEETMSALMFAYLGNYLIVNSCRLGNDHWALPFIHNLEAEEFSLEIQDETGSGYYSGSWTDGEVKVCSEYSLTSKENGERVTSSTEAFFFNDDCLFVFPGKCEDGSVVRMASSYERESEDFCEDDYERDSEDIIRIVRQLRGSSPSELLTSVLQDTYWKKYSSLLGRHFTVSFDEKGEVAVTEIPPVAE